MPRAKTQTQKKEKKRDANLFGPTAPVKGDRGRVWREQKSRAERGATVSHQERQRKRVTEWTQGGERERTTQRGRYQKEESEEARVVGR